MRVIVYSTVHFSGYQGLRCRVSNAHASQFRLDLRESFTEIKKVRRNLLGMGTARRAEWNRTFSVLSNLELPISPNSQTISVLQNK